MEVIKGDTRSLDCSSNHKLEAPKPQAGFRVFG